MNKQVFVTVRQVYGEAKAYPACGQAQIFADMLGTKTLTASALASIRKLGFEVVEPLTSRLSLVA